MRESFLAREGISGREPFYIGLALVVIGLMFLILASSEHIRFLHRLGIDRRGRFPLSLPLAAAALLLAVGVLALVSILFRWAA